MRGVVIHGHDAVDLTIVWRATREKLPDMVLQIEAIVLEEERSQTGLMNQ